PRFRAPSQADRTQRCLLVIEFREFEHLLNPTAEQRSLWLRFHFWCQGGTNLRQENGGGGGKRLNL
ncbi:MAG: hypothetical protein VX977_08440, partial [Pseudomonadota bacterium]|nr:hypothetical protein [Pseudomonadota bacterium]